MSCSFTHLACKMSIQECATKLSCQWVDWWTFAHQKYRKATMLIWCLYFSLECHRRSKLRWRHRLSRVLSLLSPTWQEKGKKVMTHMRLHRLKANNWSCSTAINLLSLSALCSSSQSTKSISLCKRRLLSFSVALLTLWVSFSQTTTPHLCQD